MSSVSSTNRDVERKNGGRSLVRFRPPHTRSRSASQGRQALLSMSSENHPPHAAPPAPAAPSPAETKRRLLTGWDISWLSLLPMGLVAAQVAARYPESIESRFSSSLYPQVSGALSRLSALLPISWAEWVVAAILLGLVAKVLTAFVFLSLRRRRLRDVAARWLIDGLSLVGLVYWVFLIVWGFNYYRLPLSQLAGLTPSPASQQELIAVCERLIGKANELRASCREDEGGVADFAYSQPERLRSALEQATVGFTVAGQVYPFLRGDFSAPKAVAASEVLSYLGISGIYFPFTAEANINTTLPQPFLPFTMCHELAHQGGFAREDEANYIAYLTCRLHPDETFRYSGYLQASVYLWLAVEGEEAERLRGLFSPGVQRDLAAHREWRRRYATFLSAASSRINDAYLKANGQADGVRSYGRMIDLILSEQRAAGHR